MKFTHIIYYTVIMAVGILIGAYIADRENKETECLEGSREVFYDTIPCYYPVPRDSVVVRYEVATLPRIDTVLATISADTVPVLVPISTMSYEDSTYRAYISGYHARLDSIFIFPRREVITFRPQPKRWAVGLTAGYAFTPHGFQPYLGVGITCKLWEF